MDLIGPIIPFVEGNYGMNEMDLTALGHKAAFIFRIPKTGTITDITFGTQSGSGGTNAVSVGLFTVDTTTGLPTTTAYGGMTTGSATFNAFQTKTVTLGTSASATKGDIVACVFQVTAFTAGTFSIGYMSETVANYLFPYAAINTGSWSKLTTARPIVGLKYSGGDYPLTLGMDSANIVTTVLSSSQSPSMVFKPTSDVQLLALASRFTVNVANASYNYYVSDNVTGRLQTNLLDTAKISAAGMTGYWLFTPPVTLSRDVTYNIGVEVNSGSGNTNIDSFSSVTSSTAWNEQATGLNSSRVTAATAGATSNGQLWEFTLITRPVKGSS
jgi:hypothetical protein